ncbi:MAG: hypothetical protein IJL63_03725 [Clostridia bacterium]|nr:hypothetical protein [Clostridia bacterium]
MDKNMDVKDLFKKLKSGGNKDARKNGSLASFFEKNPKMKIILPAVFVAIAVVVAALIIISGARTNIDVDDNISVAGQAVEVLPQVERRKTDEIADEIDPFSEDVIANAKLTGVLYAADGYYIATLETDKASYPTLQVGDKIGNSEWMVDSIDSDSITVSCGEKTRTIQKNK